MTRRDLTTRVLRALNDHPTAPVYWTQADIHASLAEGLEVLAEEVPAFTRTFTVPRREGTTVYQLPGVGTRMLAPYRIWLPDLHRRLEAHTLVDLDTRHERWQEVTGEPWWWVAVSLDQWLLWPSPTTGEGWMEVNAYCWPDPLLDDDDVPDLPPSSQEALVTYATALGRLKQWQAPETVALLRQFLGQAGSARSQASLRVFQEKTWQRGMARGTNDRRD